MQSCESATFIAKLDHSNVLLKSCSWLHCLGGQRYYPRRAPRNGLEGRRGHSLWKNGKVLSHRDGFAPHFIRRRKDDTPEDMNGAEMNEESQETRTSFDASEIMPAPTLDDLSIDLDGDEEEE